MGYDPKSRYICNEFCPSLVARPVSSSDEVEQRAQKKTHQARRIHHRDLQKEAVEAERVRNTPERINERDLGKGGQTDARAMARYCTLMTKRHPRHV